MSLSMIMLASLILLLLAVLWLLFDMRRGQRSAQQQNEALEQAKLEAIQARMSETMERKHRALSENLRDALGVNQKHISDTVQESLKRTTDTLNQRFTDLLQMSERKLEVISERVDERLHRSFEKSQQIFSDVQKRLVIIDKAQDKIASLSENVVSLQDVLTDKRARGAFGEVQLNHLLRQSLPETAFELQAQLPNGRRADCLLKLPEPIGSMVIDSKFPLENYQRMLDNSLDTLERKQAASQFKQDVSKHIGDIAERYIIEGKTADGAIMFLPSEAIFAELHAHHPGLVALGQRKRVWISSPTTMMAILSTVASVLKDVETRKQVHIIQEHLHALAKDFDRFGQRFDKLAAHIRLAHEDTEQVHISAKKITQRFDKIEQVKLDEVRGQARLDTLHKE
ncbi:MAG: DNA recombination protein RmuC [Mariprofundaceae bacterium]